MPDDISLSLKAQLALKSAGFGFTRSLGQNFIFDEELLSEIARCAGAGSGVNVIEIGPGAGLLTAVMADMGARVVAIEIDKTLAGVLESVLEDKANVKLIFADALKTDIGALAREEFGGEGYIIAANLPYYITADFILKAVQSEPMPGSITLMLQSEAADRVLSTPRDEGWCALSAITSYYCEGERLMDVPRDMFTPAPHVDSALIRLNRRSEREVPEEDAKDFVSFIKAAFAMRRKTLINNLSAAYRLPKDKLSRALTKADIDPKVRGEALNLNELARAFYALKEIYE